MRRWVWGTLIALGAVAAALGGAIGWRYQVEQAPREAGPPVGALAPAFELPQATGGTVSLAQLHAERPAAILFYRSADW